MEEEEGGRRKVLEAYGCERQLELSTCSGVGRGVREERGARECGAEGSGERGKVGEMGKGLG